MNANRALQDSVFKRVLLLYGGFNLLSNVFFLVGYNNVRIQNS